MRPSLGDALPSTLAVVLLFAAWEGACRAFGIRPFILPMPSLIAVEVWGAWPVVLNHTLTTLGTVLWGFAASVLVSLPLAMLIASSPAIFGGALSAAGHHPVHPQGGAGADPDRGAGRE